MNERLYVTGDTHSNENMIERLSFRGFPESRTFNYENKNNTFVLILGDFGGIWHDNKQERYTLKWLENRPFTTLFIDGNHENFTRLYQYPVENWKGGKIHRINSSVIHLMRGQIYEIGNRKLFTFGGAGSHDINDGILNPNAPDYTLRKKNLMKKGPHHYRTLGINYWKEELPSDAEMQEGVVNLAKHNHFVDYIITHCTYTSFQKYITDNSSQYPANVLTDYLENINQSTRYIIWFFGHYHIDSPLIQYYGNLTRCVFENIIRVF